MYEYRFDSSAGTPPGPTPTKVQYFRKYAADRYETTFTYGQANILGYKTQTYLGRQIVFGYNTNRLMSRKWYGQINYSGFPYVDMRFNRDNSGLITSITSNSNDKALTAIYNPDLEIEQVQHTMPQTFDEGYAYDTRGNRLTSLTNNYTYNDLNQLTSSFTSTFAFTYNYDADGNMIEEKNITTTETKKFYYNSENRMIKYEHYPTEIEPADIIAEYKYDIYGRRIQKNVNGAITNFHWEGDNMSFELNENNQPIRRYIYENGKDDVQGHVEYSEVDDPQYFSFERKGWYSYIKDQVGTITKVYKHETKQMVDIRTYDTFGNLVSQTGSSNGNLGFQSKYYDQESGLNYYYHRYYNPSIGRFINEDPIGLTGGLNMYGFVKNDPLNAIDPFGFDTWTGKYISKTFALFVAGKVKGGITLKNQKTGEVCLISFEGFKIGIGWDLSVSLHDVAIIFGPHCGKDLAKGNSISLEGSFKHAGGGFGFTDNGFSLSVGLSAGTSAWFGTGVVSITGITCVNTPCECEEKD